MNNGGEGTGTYVEGFRVLEVVEGAVLVGGADTVVDVEELDGAVGLEAPEALLVGAEAPEPEALEEMGSPTAAHNPWENCSAVVRSDPEQAPWMQEVEVEMNCWLAQRQVSSVGSQPKKLTLGPARQASAQAVIGVYGSA
jgi:hypothetical protein